MMTTHVVNPSHAVRADAIAHHDRGMTLVELLVAMGVFSVLMVMVSALSIQGFDAVRNATALSEVQAEQQNAMLWMSRLLRYADNPHEAGTPPPAITSATVGVDGISRDLTFVYPTSDVPTGEPTMRMARFSVANGDVVSQVWEPSLGTGVPTFDQSQTPTTRTLVRSRIGHTPSLSFTYWAVDGVNQTQVLPPPVTDVLAFTAWAEGVDKVTITLTDTDGQQPLAQTVMLVNPR
jgi:prepilin-type N-terminal cleavage/methylation domain-containing protein